MRQGFLLIEVVIALMLASMIAVSLIVSITQMSKVQVSIDTITDIFQRAAVVQQLLEKELNGAFIPEIPQQTLAATGTQAQPRRPAPQTPPSQTIEKPFVLTQKNNNLETLTFITTNPITSSLIDQKPRPRIARIMYRLVTDKAHKNSYTLMRQEGNDLDIKKYVPDAKEPLRPLEVITGIKSCAVTLYAQEPEEEGKEKKQNLITSTQWPQPQRDEKKSQQSLPLFVELKCVLWSNDYKQETPFTFTIPILGKIVKKESQQQIPPDKTPAKPQPTKQPEPPRRPANTRPTPRPAPAAVTKKTHKEEKIIMIAGV